MGIKKTRMKSRIFIFCNGELAEPSYFQDFKDHLRSHSIVIRYKKEFLKKAPWDFISASIKYKEKLISKGDFVIKDGDQSWCVFDVDDYWGQNEKKFREALRSANENDLKLAWSNECFEFWFLCHFGLYSSAVPRTVYHKKLAKHFKDKKLGRYQKNMKGIFNQILPFQMLAIKRARKMYNAGEVQNNPSTAVFRLVEEIINE